MSSWIKLHLRAAVHSAESGLIHRGPMTYVLGAIGVLVCFILIGKGYLVPLIIGGVLGSFLGIAGFGGAVSGILPGAIIGALVAKAMK